MTFFLSNTVIQEIYAVVVDTAVIVIMASAISFLIMNNPAGVSLMSIQMIIIYCRVVGGRDITVSGML